MPLVRFFLGSLFFIVCACALWLQLSGKGLLMKENRLAARQMLVDCVYFNGRGLVTRAPRSSLANNCEFVRTL